jgi:hypothetical protein
MESRTAICVKAVAPDAEISGAHPVCYIGLTSQFLYANGLPREILAIGFPLDSTLQFTRITRQMSAHALIARKYNHR